MAKTTYAAASVAANTPFTFTVPGQRIWRVLSIVATLSRAVGGTPNRALQLAITNGTATLALLPADDAGTEPGTLTVTWTNGIPASVASGATGVSLGPLPDMSLPPGYKLIGTVLNGVATDQWTAATVWVDERASE